MYFHIWKKNFQMKRKSEMVEIFMEDGRTEKLRFMKSGKRV
jgi:hypothetical protein